MSKSGLKLFQGLLRTLTHSNPVASHTNVVHKASTQIRHYLGTTSKAAVQSPLKSRNVSCGTSSVLHRFQQRNVLSRTSFGAFPRSAGGGYSIGGKRAFSGGNVHPSEIIKQTNNAIRAFLELRKTVQPNASPESIRLETASKETHNGSQLVFDMRPPFAFTQTHLTQEFVEDVAVGVQSWKSSLTTIARQLSILYERIGELPIEKDGSMIRVKFAGSDTEFVNRLLNDVGISHGLIQEYLPIASTGPSLPTAKMKEDVHYGDKPDPMAGYRSMHNEPTRLATPTCSKSSEISSFGDLPTSRATESETWSVPITFDTWDMPLTPDGSSQLSSGYGYNVDTNLGIGTPVEAGR